MIVTRVESGGNSVWLFVRDQSADSLMAQLHKYTTGLYTYLFITDLFRAKVHNLASTTKCVTSALMGITVDKGFINDVEEPIHHYLSAYSSLFAEEKKQIRIRHMLTMMPGFE